MRTSVVDVLGAADCAGAVVGAGAFDVGAGVLDEEEAGALGGDVQAATALVPAAANRALIKVRRLTVN